VRGGAVALRRRLAVPRSRCDDIRACRPPPRSITYLLLQNDEVETLARVLPALPKLRLLRYARLKRPPLRGRTTGWL